VAGAEESISKVVADATRQRLPVALVDALRIQGAIAGERESWEEADQRLGRAIQLAHDIVYPWGEGRALYEWGVVSARRGAPDRARELLMEASSLFSRLGAEPYRARCDAVLSGVRF
jgi:hypothetical protein